MNRTSAIAVQPRNGRRLFGDLPARVVAVFRDERPARALVTVCLGIFAALAVTVITAPQLLGVIDTRVQAAVIAIRQPWLDTAMVWLTFLGTRWAIGALVLALALWSAVTGKSRRFVAVIALAFLLNPVFEVLFKELVGRPRPDLARLLPGQGPSFPSGHVLASVGFYGLLPFLAWETTKKHWVRLVTLVGSVAVALGITFTRVYLDVHWTTDAIAGVLLGTVLVAGFYHVYLEDMVPAFAIRGRGIEPERALAATGTGAVSHRLK